MSRVTIPARRGKAARVAAGQRIRIVNNCRDNLHAALAELGIKIPATPPSLNVFMNIPWTSDGRLSWGEPVSTPGSYATFRAELDLVVAFSAGPQDILPINGRTGHTTEAHFSIE